MQFKVFKFKKVKSTNDTAIRIIKNNNYSADFDIYLTGIGLNLLFDNRDEIIEPFRRIPSKISKNYQYEQDSLKTLEKDFLSVFEFFSSYCEELK